MIAPPAIDPLSPKNLPVEKVVIRAALERFGVDPYRPLAVQVSRFDRWKDPEGVIRYRKVAIVGLGFEDADDLGKALERARAAA